MKTKITVICENNVNMSLSLIAEHGLSILIESEDATLFDTGQGLGIINNLTVLEKNIGAIQRVVLSHGHYDHTGGLLDVLENRGGKTPVYLHASAFNGKYAHQTDGDSFIERFIGMPKNRVDYENTGADFNFFEGYGRITEKISAITEVKRPQGWKSWDSRLKQEINGNVIDDPFMDDLSLLVETESGPVVLLGCAHAGIVEILNDISSHTGYREFYAVIGGTHLANAPKEYVKKAIDILKDFRVRIIGPAHCTGFKITCRFASEFPDEFKTASAGAVFEF